MGEGCNRQGRASRGCKWQQALGQNVPSKGLAQVPRLRPQSTRPLKPCPNSATHDFNRAPIAQLDRVLPSEGKGHWFESSWVRHKIRDLADILGASKRRIHKSYHRFEA